MKPILSLIFKNAKWCSLVLCICATGVLAKDTMEDRIKPVGDLCMAGENCASATTKASGASTRDGKSVYETKCFACHATGAAGAPKLGDAANWNARLAERGVDGMYKSAIGGFQAMPPKGACMDCSDDEMKAAVDHILANSK